MNEFGPGLFDGGMALLRMWTEFAAKMMQATAGASPWTRFPPLSPSANPAEAFREMRGTMLDAWAQAWDQFLRSPEFLEVMGRSLAGSTQLRKQWNDLLGNLQHQFQGVSRQDVDQVMLNVRHLEQRMVQAVDDISTRLEKLDDRLSHRKGRRRKDKRRREDQSPGETETIS